MTGYMIEFRHPQLPVLRYTTRKTVSVWGKPKVFFTKEAAREVAAEWAEHLPTRKVVVVPMTPPVP